MIVTMQMPVISTDFNVLFYANPQPLLIYDVGTLRYLEVNEAACLNYGYTKEEFLQLSIKDLRPAEDEQEAMAALKNLSGNRTVKRPFRHRHKNGVIIYVEITSYNIVFENKNARLVIPNDVTALRLNELKLQQALASISHTLENISDGHFKLNHEDEVIAWNKAAEVLTGVESAAILQQNFWKVIPLARKAGFYNRFTKAVQTGAAVKFEEYFSHTRKWFYCSLHPSAEGVSVYFQDITEIKKHQHELSVKNKHLEKVAYFNSHQLRRPVANILGLYPLLCTAANEDEKAEIAAMIHQSCRDIDQAIKQVDQVQEAATLR